MRYACAHSLGCGSRGLEAYRTLGDALQPHGVV